MADESDVKAMRDWLLKQPHLPQNLEDRLLARFLITCGGSLERTKTTIELFFTVRAETPEVFCNRDPNSSAVQNTFNLIHLIPLQGFTPEGDTCFLFSFADSDPDKFNGSDVLKLFFMESDIKIRSELDSVTNVISIFDMSGWTLTHLIKLTPLLKKGISYAEDAQPAKIKAIHIINAIPLMDKIMSVVRPFISNESANMFHIHPIGSDSLYKYVPKDMLPVEFGGKSGTVAEIKEKLKKMVEEERDWFLTDEWMADESKRVGRKHLRRDMAGSFRSLSID